ncbi:MAG: hypothetical protein RIT16_131, partial [Actinomycetota bacterium]
MRERNSFYSALLALAAYAVKRLAIR